MPLLLASGLVCSLLAACDSGDDEAKRPRTSAPSRPATTEPRSARARRPPDTVAINLEPRLPRGSITREDRRERVRVTYPANWHYSREDLSQLAPPAEILVVGSFPIRRDPRANCSGDPAQPEIRVGRTEALVVVQETDGRAELAPRRPRRFRLRKQVRPVDPSEPHGTQVFPWNCLNRVGIVGTRTPFGDDGRVLDVTAIVGASASAATRKETLGVLNSLEFGR